LKKVAIFLGINSSAGGMFQYAQSIIDAVKFSKSEKIEFIIIYTDNEWKNQLVDYPCKTYQIKNSKFGNLLSKFLVLLQLSINTSKFISRHLNPIVKEVMKLKPDIIFYPCQDYLSFQTDIVSISTIHDLMHIYENEFPEVSKNLRFIYRQYRYKAICSNSKAILVDSEVGKNHVLESYDVDKDIIFPLHYVPPKYIYDNKKNNAEINLPKKYLFYPAQFWEHKNHKRLLKAIKLSKEKFNDINIVFTGRKNHIYKELLNYVKELSLEENVHFIGKIEDVHMSDFYKKARALIFPSFFGPTNIPPLEAIVCDCPMAVSGIYGMPNQLKNSALYFDPRDVLSISECINQLWSDDKTCELLLKNSQIVKNEISFEIFTERFISIIENI